ncbi:MAG: SDR family NAD(P)-dependent oxidoreductase [Candidatus Heimdallarchaeota archaeon]
MAKAIVITGATSGLGLSHAVYLLSKGYTVFGTSRKKNPDLKELKEIYLRDHTKWKFSNKEKTEVIAKKILVPKKILANLDELLKKIQFYKMDVTSDKEVNDTIIEINEIAKASNGRGIDVLINNAGISFYESAEGLSMENWQKTFDTNFFGVLRVVRAVLPFMKERGNGQIINTSSLGGVIAIPFQSHYCASKAAIKLLTEGLHVELRQLNIKVSVLLPSDINTNFNKNTGKLTNDTFGKLDSINLKEMIDNNPMDKKSPHFTKAEKVWSVIIKNLIVMPPPIAVSRKILKIINTRKPKISYFAGDFFQAFLLLFVRRFVSENFAYFILPKYYGM